MVTAFEGIVLPGNGRGVHTIEEKTEYSRKEKALKAGIMEYWNGGRMQKPEEPYRILDTGS